jgi:hypothetical protein
MGLVCLSILRKLTKSPCQTEGTRDASRTRLFECEGGGGKSRISLLAGFVDMPVWSNQDEETMRATQDH